MNQQPSAITLDQFIALSDEIVALSRSGVPIEKGLLALSKDMPGRLGSLTENIGRRMQQGESLENIIASQGESFPAAYRAALTAGMRSGNLAAALEGIASNARRVAHLRKLLGASLIYPIVVLFLAYFLFVFTIMTTIPSMIEAFSYFDVSTLWPFQKLAALGQSAYLWVAWPPLGLLLLFMLCWWRSGKALVLAPGKSMRILERIPSLNRVLRLGQLACFTDLLALLIEHNVPLNEAILLAAQSGNNNCLEKEALQIAEAIEKGQRPNFQSEPSSYIPPSLYWLLSGVVPQSQIAASLRRKSKTYQLHAEKTSRWLSLYFPIILSAGVGGTATLTYGLVVLGPWFNFLYEYSQP